MKLRPNIRYFHSSQYINDLANGDICVAIGWSGDVMQAANRAKEAKNGVNVAYAIPKEGALTYFDMFAMPADAKNKDAAYQFLNFLMKPDVMAGISNYVYYANAVKDSTPLVNAEVRNNPNVYPPADLRAKLFTLNVQSPKLDRVITRAWTKVKSGSDDGGYPPIVSKPAGGRSPPALFWATALAVVLCRFTPESTPIERRHPSSSSQVAEGFHPSAGNP